MELERAFEKELAAWDGKSTDDLTAFYRAHHGAPGFNFALIDLLSHPELQKGATWLLKHHLEEDGEIGGKNRDRLFHAFASFEDWETKLHALQCLPFLKIPEGQQEPLASFLRDSLKSDNKFVRAWAYSGFHTLSSQFSRYEEEANLLIKRAMESEDASVKARLRRVL